MEASNRVGACGFGSALQRRGHIVNCWDAWNEMAGHAHGITIDPRSGVLAGGADPRNDGAAIGH